MSQQLHERKFREISSGLKKAADAFFKPLI
jgi:hypothetical protein